MIDSIFCFYKLGIVLLFQKLNTDHNVTKKSHYKYKYENNNRVRCK